MKKIGISSITTFTLLALIFWAAPQLKAQNCSVNAGIDAPICANEQLFLRGSSTGPLGEGSFLYWTQVAGPSALIVDPTDPNTEVKGLIGGENYTFRLNTTCEDGAFTYQDVSYQVRKVTFAEAGPDAIYCPGETASLAGNIPAAGENGFWSGGGNGISVDNPNDPNSTLTISGSSSGSTTLSWTVIGDNGCSSYDEVVITNRGGELPVSAGPDQELDYCYSSFQSTKLQGSYGGSGIDGQQGSWQIISGPNVPEIANPHAHNTNISKLIEGSYVFRWTVEGPCVSGSDEVTITVPAPTADVTGASIPGGDQLFCDPTITSTVLNGLPPQYINEQVQWEQTSGPEATIVNPNSPVTEITGLVSPNSYTFRYTISNPTLGTEGCSSSASQTVSYLPNAPVINITTPSPILAGCGESSVAIEFTAGGSGASQYRIVSGPSGTGMSFPTSWLGAGSSPVNIGGLEASGTYLVEMRRHTTSGIGCSSQFDQISIVISEAAIASNPGTAQILDCNVTATTLIGNDPGERVGTWSQVSGPSSVLLTNIHAPELAIENLEPAAEYVFRWLISGGPSCQTLQQDVTVITAGEPPLVADAGANQEVCSNSPVYLDATPPLYAYERGKWTVSPSEGVTFSDARNPKAVVSGLQANTSYTFTWTVSNGCGSTSDAITINVTDDFGPIAADAGDDQCIEAGLIQLAGNNPELGTGQWILLDGPGTASFNDDTQYNTTVNVNADGTYRFEWIVSSGNGCNPTRDTVTVTIGVPIETAEITVANPEVCGNEVTLIGTNPGTNTLQWRQISGNAGNTIVSPNSSETQVTGLVEGVYVFEYEISNGVCFSKDSIKIYVSSPAPSEAVAGDDINLCGESVATMNALAPTAGTGSWSLVSGPATPTIANLGAPNTTISGLITGTYVLRWTVSGGIYCDNTSDEVAITVLREADAGDDQSYCEEITAVNLVGTVASNGTWTQISGPNVSLITPTSGNTAIASGLVPGIYTFQYEIAVDGCTTTDQMTVTLYPPPSVSDAGDDFEACDAASFSMTATVPTNGIGTWSVLSGPEGGSFSNVNDPTATFNNPAYGVYVFQWTVANGDCSNADQVRYTNFQPPSLADAGIDQELTCGTTAVMTANNPEVGVGKWTFVSKTGDGPIPVITSPILYNTSITNLGPQTDSSPETYTFQWEISNGDQCAITTDLVTITVYQTPTKANAGDNQELCDQSTAILAATEVTTGTGAWTVISKPTGAPDPVFLPDAATNNAQITGLVYGEYGLEWTTSTEYCSSSDQVSITNWESPSTATATDITECLYQPVVLTGNAPTVGTGLWVQTGGPEVVITNPSSPNTSLLGLTADSYTFKWTISNGPICAPSSVEATVIITPLPTIADAGPDKGFCNTNSTTLAGNTATEGIGTWTIVSGGTGVSITDVNDPTTTVTNIPEGNHRLRWTISNGVCTDYFDEVNISRYPEMEVTGPADEIVCIGGSQNLTVVASGGDQTGYNYQWYQSSTPGGPWTEILGATGASYAIPTNLALGEYYYYAEVSNCTTVASDIAKITVVADPEITTQPDGTDLCSGGTHSMSVAATGDPGAGSLSYQWQTREGTSGGWTNISGATGTNYITAELTATAPNTTIRQYRARVRQTASGCEAISNAATVTIFPIPEVTSPSTATICNGDDVNYSITSDVLGTTFSWTATLQSGTATGFSNGSGDEISQVLTNSTNSPAVVRYTITPTGPAPVNCTGSEFVYDVTINPTPDVMATPVSERICSGSATDIVLSTNISGATVTYSWTAVLQSGSVSGFSADSGNDIQQTLTNTGNTEAVVRYTITPVIDDCTGTPITVDITVNPAGQVNDIDNQVVCNTGNTQTVTFSTSRTDGFTTYDWTNNSPSIGLAASRTGDIPTFTASNTGTSPVTATIAVIPTYTNSGVSCVGPAKSFTITVNPTAQVDNPGAQTWCNGASALLNFTTDRTGGTTTYAWTNDNPAIGLAASGNGNLSFTATNTGTTPISATIEVAPIFSNGGVDCSGPAERFTITVNPSGQVNVLNSQELCNGETTGEAIFSTDRIGGTTTYSWTNDLPSIGLAASGTGNIPEFTAINTGNVPVTATITVTPYFEGCAGPAKTFNYTVHPTPVVISDENLLVCSGDAVSYIPESNVEGTTFTWTAANTVGTVTGFTESGSGEITDILTNAAQADGAVTYTIIPTGPAPLNCPGPAFHLVVNVSNCNPLIGVAKQLVNTTYQPDGTANVTFNIRVQNYGNVDLFDVQVEEDLATVFGSGNFELLQLSSTSFDVNTSFNGETDNNLLNNGGTSNTLAIGASTNIVLEVRVLTPDKFNNQVNVSADSPGGSTEDVSQNGSDPDPDGDGDPTNNSEVTPIEVGSCTLTANVTQNSTCGNAAGAVTLTGSEAGTISFNGREQSSPATFTGLQAGWYSALFTAINGCKTTVNFEITNSDSDLAASVTAHKDVSCNGLSDGEATVTPAGGTAPYSFELNGASETDGIFTELPAGEYGAKITDANGCTYTVSFDIDEPTALVAEIVSSTDVRCNGANNGAATVNAVGGTTPYSYLWSNGQTTARATGLAAGNYTVTITDDNGCETTANVRINEPAAELAILLDQAENPSCNGADNGSIEITLSGGTAPYTYSWSNGYNSEDPAGLAAGDYTLIVTDANGCTATESYTLTEPGALLLEASNIENTSCNASVGAVTLTGSEAGTVSLNGTSLASPATFTGLAAGYYTAYFENAEGCMAEVSFNIINTNSDLSATVNVTDPLCVGETVRATVTASGGTEPYTYILNGTTTNATGIFDNLVAGDYNILVTDNKGCTYYMAFDIDEPTALVAEIVSSTDVRCNGANNGAATVNAVGGTTPYSYLWSNGQTTARATGLAAGDYTVTITDDNGCETTANVTIEENTCAPFANDDNIVSPEDMSATGNVLNNDSDPNGLLLEVVTFEIGGTTYTAGNTANIPEVGTLVVNPDGAYQFTPEENYSGSVPTATYTVSNGTETSSADLTIVVTPVNDVPETVADSYTTTEDTPVAGNLASNDTPSGDGGNIWSVDTKPGNGSLEINSDGTFTYTPDNDFYGTDNFTYKLCDVDDDCVSETVEVTVSPVNDNPVAVDDYIATNEDVSVTIPVVENDNFGGDTPSSSVISIVSQPSNGQAVINNNGTPNDPTDDFVEYTPNPDFNGSDNFEYEICDANGDCDRGNVIVNVNPVDDSPLAVEDSEIMNEDAIQHGNVSTNDTPSGDGGNIWTVVANPSHGTVIMNPDGSYTYTPEENFNGSDSFTYQLCDVDGSCSTATVDIEVEPVNDLPVIADVMKAGPEDEEIAFDSSDFSDAFSDIDGDRLTQIEIVTLPENGTLYLDGIPVNPTDNIDVNDIPLLAFTPDEDWNGTTSFDWNGYDENSKALINEQVIIQITPVNDLPTAGVAEIQGQLNPGGTNTIELPASGFSGIDKDGIIDFILITEMPIGAASITVDGTVYTTIPVEGIKVPSTDGGQPLFDIEIDPADGVSEVVLEYAVIDNEEGVSESPGSVTIPFSGLTVSGTVLSDTNGLSDNIVNGTGSNAGGALYMNLVNDLNQVVASVFVKADGTYTFTESDGLEAGKTYKLILSNGEQIIGTVLSTASYPEGYTSTGENIGSGSGNDGTIDGSLSINTNSGSLTEANFGITGEMTVYAGDNAEMCSSEARITLSGASAGNYKSLLWTTNGTGTFDDATILNPAYTPSLADIADGQVQLTLTAKGFGAVPEMFDVMTLSIWAEANVYAGSDFTSCANQPVILTGATVTEYGTLTWSTAGGTFNNIHALNPTFTPTTSGDIELVLTATGLGSCSNSSDTIVITVSEEMVLSTPEVTNANCDSREDGSVRLDVESGGIEPFTFELSTGESNSTGEFNGLAAGGYIYWVTDADGCTATGSFKIDDPNELELIVTAENDVNCNGGSNGSASLEAFGGTAPYTFTWSDGVLPDNPTANPQTVTGLSAGLYVVTVTDANGCSEIESLEIEEPDSLTVILVDQVNPDCNNSGRLIVSGAGGVSPYAYSSSSGIVTENVISNIAGGDVIVTITDANGCTNELAVTLVNDDKTAPEIICPEPIEASNTIGECTAEIVLEVPEYTDNCAGDMTILYMVYDSDNDIHGPFDASNNTFEFSTGINQVRWMVIDSSGNESTCMQKVTVHESENPLIVCKGQEEYVFNSTQGLCGYRIPDTSLDISASDNCQLLSVSHNFGGWGGANSLKGAVFPVGSTEVTWTATDYSGNAVSCSYTVTVVDNEEPVFENCPDGAVYTVGLFPGACEGGAIWSTPGSWDACSNVTVTQTGGPAQGTILEAGIHVIEYTATDASGNSSTCSFTLNVIDTEGPVIVCQPDMVKANDDGVCTWTSPEGSLSPLLANSNCPASVNWHVSNPDGTTISGIDDVSGYTFQPGTSTVNYSISEQSSGQNWECSFTVTIIDQEKPEIICPEDLTVTAPPGECAAKIRLTIPEFSDNCSSSPAEVSYVVYAPDNSMSQELSSADLNYTFMAGISRIEWKVTDAAGNAAICWQSVWVNADRDALIPDAGANATICESDSFYMTDAFASDFATVEWRSSGTGYFIDPSVVNPVYVPSASDILDGFVILTITSSSSCESASDNMVLSIAKPPIVSAGNDAVICQNDTWQLNGNSNNSAFAVEWQTTGTGKFNNTGIFNPVYTPSEEDIELGSVTLIIRGISAGSCESSTDSMTLVIHRQPEIFAGQDAWICENQSLALSEATLKDGGPVSWSTNGTGTFEADHMLNTIYTPSKGDILNGRVVLRVTYASNGPCATVSDELILNISRQPEIDAGDDLSTCFGVPVTINSASAVNVQTIQWQSSGAGTLEHAHTLSPTYVPATGESGEIVLNLIATGNGVCQPNVITDELILTIQEKLTINVGGIDTIFHNSQAVLDVLVEKGSGAYFYSWKPSSLVLNDQAAYTETINLLETTEFKVTVTDVETGCVAEANKMVVVDDDSERLLKFFNGFTPNADGLNDTWQIEGIEKFPENEVLFFNRWGDQVKELQNYNNGTVAWDGTNNKGKPLPDGTYYYIVTLKNVKSYTGWVHIRSGN